ncbi:hypothetical protein F2P79_012412 [Pimephales promelas]|nr:hypothetical protein F2P79_012412 [Pimephales promelas]
MKAKPIKWGIKLFLLADPSNGYTSITVLRGHRDRGLHLDLEEIVVLLLDLKNANQQRCETESENGSPRSKLGYEHYYNPEDGSGYLAWRIKTLQKEAGTDETPTATTKRWANY